MERIAGWRASAEMFSVLGVSPALGRPFSSEEDHPGAIAALALTRLMATLLYRVSPTDVWTFALVSATVVTFVLLACYVPSRRATRIDPNLALRYE